MGSHDYNGKRLPWDESCRVQVLIRNPGIIKPASSSNGLLSTIDLHPEGRARIAEVQRKRWAAARKAK
jgi:hypothetical protein